MLNVRGCLCGNTCHVRSSCVLVWVTVDASLSVHAEVWVALMCWSVTYSRLYCLLRFLSCHCQYDGISHKHSQTFYSHCTLFASFLSDRYARTDQHMHQNDGTLCHFLFDQSYRLAQLSQFSCVHCHLSWWSWTWQLGVNHPDIGSRDKPQRGSEIGHSGDEL